MGTKLMGMCRLFASMRSRRQRQSDAAPLPQVRCDQRFAAGYGIRLPTGEVQMLTGKTVVTNQLADGLLGGGAALVWVDDRGATTPLEVLLQDVPDFADEEGANR